MNKYEVIVTKNNELFCRIELSEILEVDAVRKAKDIFAAFGPAFNVSIVRWESDTMFL